MTYVNNLYSKQLLYCQRFSFSWLELHASQDLEVMDTNMRQDLFPIHHFVCTYTHNLRTIGCIWMFYLSSNCSTIRDIYQEVW